MTTTIPKMFENNSNKNVRYINLILDTDKHEDAPIFSSVKKKEKGGYEVVKHGRDISGLISSIGTRKEKVSTKTGAEIEVERLSISLIARDENDDIATLYVNLNLNSGFARSIVCSLMSIDSFADKPIKICLYRNKETSKPSLIIFDEKREKVSRHPDYNLGDLWKKMTKKVVINKEEKTDTVELDEHIKSAIDILSSKPMHVYVSHDETKAKQVDAALDAILDKQWGEGEEDFKAPRENA